MSTKKITYKITVAVRERIIVDNCERLKVTAKFSDGQVRSFHFELGMKKPEIKAILDKLCVNLANESVQAEVDAPRLKAEKEADATAKSLLQ